MDNLTEKAPAKLSLLRKAQQAQRMDRMEPDAHKAAEKAFFSRYHQYEDVLKNAVNDRNTIAHPKLKEAFSDMRAALIMRKALRQHRSNEINATATRESGERINTETPEKALNWVYRNTWFNAVGFELETAAARSIDQDIDMAGYDKNSDEYYNLLSKRPRQIFPDLLIDVLNRKMLVP